MLRTIMPLVALMLLLNFMDLVSLQPVVDTTLGPIRGSEETNNEDFPYLAFRGVPFAAPPVGELRWEKPQPAEPWEDVRDTTQFSAHCDHLLALVYPAIGLSNETSEDCLYLNVYVPGGEINPDEPKSVMFFIYGGAYILGTAAMYPLENLALSGDVIVVSTNYRLSAIGFLSTEDDVAPGNYALWDIQAALLWVQENIEAFGGDPNSVTVFGQSAGGALTSHMMISPQTKGLVTRGISISGGSSGYFGIAGPGMIADTTQSLARLVGCRRLNTSQELIDCLREVDAMELQFYALAASVVFNLHLPNLIPRIDGDFIPENPRDAWQNGAADDIDFMSGYCHHDAAGFVMLNFLGLNTSRDFNFARSNSTLYRYFTFLTNQYPGGDDCVEAIYERYPELITEDETERKVAATEVQTQWTFESASFNEVDLHSTTSPDKGSYLYDFWYRQSFLEYSEEWVEGSHIDDLYSVFGDPFLKEFREFSFDDPEFSTDDLAVSGHLMTYYSNFAKTGDPNLGATVPVEWPKYTSDSPTYMQWGTDPTVVTIDQTKIDNYNFWREDFWEIAYPEGKASLPKSHADIDVEKMFTEFLSQMEMRFADSPDVVDSLKTTAHEILLKRKLRLENDQE